MLACDLAPLLRHIRRTAPLRCSGGARGAAAAARPNSRAGPPAEYRSAVCEAGIRPRQMRYFFERLDEPIRATDEDNCYNLTFLHDNVRSTFESQSGTASSSFSQAGRQISAAEGGGPDHRPASAAPAAPGLLVRGPAFSALSRQRGALLLLRPGKGSLRGYIRRGYPPAGLPTTSAWAGTSLVTTLPVPTMA